jgi:hypothetical protein
MTTPANPISSPSSARIIAPPATDKTNSDDPAPGLENGDRIQPYCKDMAQGKIRLFKERYRWVLWTKLDQNKPAVAAWLDKVKNSLPADKQEKLTVIDLMTAIVGAYRDYKIIYRGGPVMRYGQDGQGASHVQPPEMYLKTRRGKCTDNSLLVAGTLLARGEEAVLIMTKMHVVAAAVSDSSEIAGITGVKLPVSLAGRAAPVYLYAISPEFYGTYDIQETIADGQNFIKRNIDKTSGDVRIFHAATGEEVWNNECQNMVRGILFGQPIIPPPTGSLSPNQTGSNGLVLEPPKF